MYCVIVVFHIHAASGDVSGDIINPSLYGYNHQYTILPYIWTIDIELVYFIGHRYREMTRSMIWTLKARTH